MSTQEAGDERRCEVCPLPLCAPLGERDYCKCECHPPRQEARDDGRGVPRDISGHRAILVQKAYSHADDMRRYDDTEDLVSTLVEMANLLIGDARKNPELKITEEMVDRAAQKMFEPDGPGGDYTWAEMVREHPTRADVWRADARDALEAALRVPVEGEAR